MRMLGRVLVIAGSDSGGGAGIQGDVKTITALGGYAATAVTALTVQNTKGVQAVHPVPPAVVAAQMRAVLADLGADAVKTGMLHDAGVIDAVCDVLDEMAADVPLVVDPVMLAKGGEPLLEREAVERLKARLLPRAAIVTPNAPELAALTGLAVETTEDLGRAATALLDAGPAAVLAKGGHVPGGEVVDLLVGRDGAARFAGPRFDTPHTHGTGCALASAVAAGLAQGLPLKDAVARARAYVAEAIRTAPGYGSGRGPLNHAHTVKDGAGKA